MHIHTKIAALLKANQSLFINAIAIIIFYIILQLFGITCPIKYITGISCAGCGMTRAWIAVLHMDFSKACFYHPLFFIPPIALLLFIFRARLNKKLYRFFLRVVIFIFLSVYLYRMIFLKGPVVVFRPADGIIYHILINIKKVLSSR